MTEIEAYLQNPTDPAKAAALYNQYVKKGLASHVLKKPKRYLKKINYVPNKFKHRGKEATNKPNVIARPQGRDDLSEVKPLGRYVVENHHVGVSPTTQTCNS